MRSMEFGEVVLVGQEGAAQDVLEKDKQDGDDD